MYRQASLQRIHEYFFVRLYIFIAIIGRFIILLDILLRWVSYKLPSFPDLVDYDHILRAHSI